MNKNYLLSKNKDLDEVERQARREKEARHILHTIKTSKSTWLRLEMVRNAFFYLDLNFMKQELIEIYKNKQNPDKVRHAILALHDGSLDVSDLIQEAKENEVLFKDYENFKKEFEREFIEDTEYEKDLIIPKHIGPKEIMLLKSRQNL